MRKRPPLRLLLSALALCAVALLNVAVVRSRVMQAAMAEAPASTCRALTGAMPGMTSPSAPARKEMADHKACAFCSAAAHAPIQSVAPSLPPAASVSWMAPPTWASLGPRGPPARESRARGPPASSLTA